MRSRTPLFALLFAVGLFALPLAAHAAIPFFGPIIPQEANQAVCPAGFGMLMIVINNVISFLITIAIVFVAPLMIAYAGFLYVVNPVDPSGISKAKGILWNTITGIVVALAGWMIVDAVMAVLYNPSARSGTTVLTTWSNLITTGGAPLCLPQAGALPGDSLKQSVPGVRAGGAPTSPPPGKVGTACDPAAVKAAAATGGYALTDAQASTFACIAAPESTCGSNLQNYKWNTGVPGDPGSTGYGAFQVLLKTNSSCYENQACYGAAGIGGGSKLNCASGFDSVGNPIPGSVVVQQCTQAASSLDCSASAAACLLQQKNGSFSPWQADMNSAKQTGCITSGA